MKKYPYLMVLACLAFMVIAGLNAFKNPPTGNYIVTIHVSDYTLQGPPTVSASFIEQVLANAGSPAAGTGQALYSLGVQYGIDPVYALAFFAHESTFGTSGEAPLTRSLGNERCIADRPCNARGFAVFTSWVDGFDHWYSLMLHGYIQSQINQSVGRKVCPCLTVEQIVPVYAPDSDGNDVAGYIAAIEQDVMQLRAGQVNL